MNQLIRLTKKTCAIKHFIEENGFITNNMCARIFYKGNSNSYTQAQVKLKSMYDNKILKRYIHPNTKEYIYQITIKNIDDHKKYIGDLYSRIYLYTDEIIYAKLNESSWKATSRRNDAHIIYRKGDKVVGLLIEFDKFHKTSFSKIDDIYNSGEVQEWYYDHYGVKDYFPTVMIINPTGTINYKSDKWSCVSLDYSFDNLQSLL